MNVEGRRKPLRIRAAEQRYVILEKRFADVMYFEIYMKRNYFLMFSE